MKKLLFSLLCAMSVLAVKAQTTHAGHAYVDLGLPSGTLWATCNVGATNPEDYGDYFAWGETEPKSYYNWSSTSDDYKWGGYTGIYPDDGMTKYNKTDCKTILDAADDAATTNWGGDWRTPTKAEQYELLTECTWTWTKLNGVDGFRITSKTDTSKSIFLPAAGARQESDTIEVGAYGSYWSSSRHKDHTFHAYNLSFLLGDIIMRSDSRYKGLSIRPVWSENSITTMDPVHEGHEYVDLGLPSGTLWATCNVGAIYPTEYGEYFAWGETQVKENYEWSTYKYCNGSANTLTKYCTRSDLGTVDNKTTLESSDDAATANWGGNWRMPTEAENEELLTECTWTWTMLNSVYGFLITSKKDTRKSIFLPAAGYRKGTMLVNVGVDGYYWPSSVDLIYSAHVHVLRFESGNNNYATYSHRYNGYSVRPVLSPNNNTAVENVEQDKSNNTRKVIENGQVVIIRDGVRYNVLGVRL